VAETFIESSPPTYYESIHLMKILRKLLIITLCIASLLPGCRMLPPGKPLQAEESLSQVEAPAPATTSETEPPTTTSAATTPTATKTALTTPRAPNSKPRLSYTVSEGELLWTIAKRVDVYGDPLLWPLLYQANRDQIKDPRTIYAGQTFTVPRNVSEQERENARSLAKKSDIFSPE
jgi:hypothetical protein